MQQQIDGRQEECEILPLEKERQSHVESHQTECEIKYFSSFFPYYDHQCALSYPSVIVAVTIIIHHQQRVDDHSASQRRKNHLFRQRMRLYIERHAYRHQSEEHQDQQITQPDIRQQQGIEKTKNDTCHSYPYQVVAAIKNQRKTYDTGYQSRHSNGATHRFRSHPTLRTCTARSQPVLIICSLLPVKVIVDEVRIYLHDKSKQYAKDGRNPRQCSGLHARPHCIHPACLLIEPIEVSPCQCEPHHHGYGCPCKRFRTGCQQPCIKGILAHRCGI